MLMVKARIYKRKDFVRILRYNNFVYERTNGDHDIYVRDGVHISIPYQTDLNRMLTRRLIKEYKLKIPS